MGITKVDLDDRMLAEAARLLGTKTKTDTINAALAEVIVRHRRRAAIQRLAECGAEGGMERLRLDWEARKAAQHRGPAC